MSVHSNATCLNSNVTSIVIFLLFDFLFSYPLSPFLALTLNGLLRPCDWQLPIKKIYINKQFKKKLHCNFCQNSESTKWPLHCIKTNSNITFFFRLDTQHLISFTQKLQKISIRYRSRQIKLQCSFWQDSV